MEAPEFIIEKTRMCRRLAVGIPVCQECPVLPKAKAHGTACTTYIKEHPHEAVRIIERWAKEHPRKTRQSELLKLFPRAGLGDDGLVGFCPEDMDSEFVCPRKERGPYAPDCGDCRKKYWLEEVKDDDQSND